MFLRSPPIFASLTPRWNDPRMLSSSWTSFWTKVGREAMRIVMGFHSHGGSWGIPFIAGWFRMDPKIRWGYHDWGYPHDLGNLHIVSFLGGGQTDNWKSRWLSVLAFADGCVHPQYCTGPWMNIMSVMGYTLFRLETRFFPVIVLFSPCCADYPVVIKHGYAGKNTYRWLSH